MLERVRIFDEESWIAYNFEHFQKWRVVAKNVIEEARTLYCRFSLYQSLGWSQNGAEDGTRTLRNILEEEEVSIQCFMGVLNKWMGSYSQLKSTLNTLYIVGGPRTYAETFCNSIANIFACMVTCDLHQSNLDTIFEMAQQIKILYFPPSKAAKVDNPYLTSILSGRQMNVIVGGKMLRVPQIKCLVRLQEMPGMDDLPTSKDQHFIIHFQEEVSEPINFTVHELRKLMLTYMENETTAGRRAPTVCINEYSVLCSSRAEHECIQCSRLYLF